MATRRRYPVGIQTFKTIKRDGYIYIDKTEYIYRLAHENGKYFFLSRPRRFGKSLLTSTLESYFAGERELFKGLAIDELEKDWTQYPVIHFDLSGAKHMDKDRILRHLAFILTEQEKKLGITEHPDDVSDRVSNLIVKAKEKTGKDVVMLIDEYDAPLLDVVHDEEKLDVLRNVMRDFYSPLKKYEPDLRFVFLTGITKFSQLSIFSELNNITNISMRRDYAGICGITKDEVNEQMSEDVDILASALNKTHDEVIAELTRYYDGYHFAWPSPDIFNPFSLLSAFASKTIQPFWFSTGTPTYLLEMMKKFNFLPTQFKKMDAQATDFDAPTENMTSIIPLLYQSGYLTIKDLDEMFGSYTLDIPNREVEIGLMKSFIPNYIMPNTLVVNNTAVNMARALYKGDMDKALQELQTFLGTVPYTDNTNYEGHYQQIFFIIFSLLGAWADVEVHSPRGRVDVVLTFMQRMYIIELKLNSSAEAAMAQINLKDYSSRFATCGYPVTKVAINFDSETRNIKDWKIE